MTGSRTAGIVVLGVVALVLAAGSRAVPSAQTRDTATNETQVQAQAQTQALRDLVGEVRALRGVIESYTVGQAQSQTLSDLLTVQQRRVADATGRLDVIRRELEGAAVNTARLRAEISPMEETVRVATEPKLRAQMEFELQRSKDELERQAEQESRLRARESELLGVLGFEEANWNALVDRVNRSLGR